MSTELDKYEQEAKEWFPCGELVAKKGYQTRFLKFDKCIEPDGSLDYWTISKQLENEFREMFYQGFDLRTLTHVEPGTFLAVFEGPNRGRLQALSLEAQAINAKKRITKRR